MGITISSMQKTPQISPRISATIIMFLFLCSGFSGLIYESIWTHYLKLLLGHSAYAQTLVMTIFMGGLAIGAWITSQYIYKIKSLLLTYAFVEIVLGLFAFFFHDIFQFFNNFLFLSLPGTNVTPTLFSSIKWSGAILLILPQSILLGTTFPLISSGLLQISDKQEHSGNKFSLLYFSNSFGAAIGALVSGFVLIQAYGFPGTIKTAGWINIFVGLSIIFLTKIIKTHKKNHLITQTVNSTIEKNNLYLLIMASAFFTGMASFCYEIAWIRMLTLVLGATTHAFELMISAFILGLALGSFWIKQRIDNLVSPIKTLAVIQILMAISALLTLIFYDKMFDLMVFFLEALNKSEPGYTLYLFINHFFALLLMLPATFFAGMTLPLMTNILYTKQKNERVIGHIYSINTLGAIVGIIFSINIIPVIEVQGVINAGALIDITIAIALLSYIFFNTQKLKLLIYTITPLVIIIIVNQFNVLNPLKIASSVFRSTGFKEIDSAKNMFHRDGKLSTVDITRYSSGAVTLTTNGKPDASVNLYGTTPTVDESTMILMGALPLAINPQIKNVANIGMGSGQTVQSLLSYKNISRVDTIEIEQGVIDALPEFKIYSQLARYDKRSHIFIDDAKSFFATRNQKYDLIISEPSNPWVSGTSSLFSTEFYRNIKNNLTETGIFSQWLQLYEINLDDLAPVFKALSENFENYVVYNSNSTDILIFASNKIQLNKLSQEIFNSSRSQALLHRIKIRTIDDLKARYIGDKKTLQPLFNTYPTPITTDYYPKLDYSAAKSLFMQESAVELTDLNNYIYPVAKYLDQNHSTKTLKVLNDIYFQKTIIVNNARHILNVIKNNDINNLPKNSPVLLKELSYLINKTSSYGSNTYGEQALINILFGIAKETLPHIEQDSQKILWDKIEQKICCKNSSSKIHQWISLHKANALKQYDVAFKLASKILSQTNTVRSQDKTEYLVTSILFSSLKTGNVEHAKKLWKRFSKIYKEQKNIPISLRLLMSHINKV